MVAGPITVGPKPPRRHEHAAVALDKHLWLFGGSTDGGFLGDLWAFAPDRAQWASLRPSGGHYSRHMPPLSLVCHSLTPPSDLAAPAGATPSARKGHGMAALGTEIYVWGGCASSCSDVAVHVLDTRAMRWSMRNSTTGTPPVGRAGHAMVRARTQDRSLRMLLRSAPSPAPAAKRCSC